MSIPDISSAASSIALTMLSVALLLAFIRLARGPSLPDTEEQAVEPEPSVA